MYGRVVTDDGRPLNITVNSVDSLSVLSISSSMTWISPFGLKISIFVFKCGSPSLLVFVH